MFCNISKKQHTTANNRFETVVEHQWFVSPNWLFCSACNFIPALISSFPLSLYTSMRWRPAPVSLWRGPARRLSTLVRKWSNSSAKWKWPQLLLRIQVCSSRKFWTRAWPPQPPLPMLMAKSQLKQPPPPPMVQSRNHDSFVVAFPSLSSVTRPVWIWIHCRNSCKIIGLKI